MSELETAVPELETTEAETPETVESAEPEVALETAPETEQAEATPAAALADPQAIRDGDVVKFLREQTKLAPESAKLHRTLQDSYFRAAEYSKLFDNIDDARTIKTHLEALGGLDGLTELQSLQADVAELDRKVAEGDPSVITAMAEESPAGFRKMVPVALDTLYRIDPHGYNEVLTPLIARTLADSPLADSVALAIERLRGGEADAALRELSRIAATFEGLKQYQVPPSAAAPAAASAGAPAANPAVEQLGAQVRAYLDSTIQTELKTALDGRNVSDAARARLLAAVVSEVDRAFAGDRNYAARVNALLRAGQTDRALAFIKQSVDQVRPRALRQVVTELYGNTPARPATARPGAQPAAKTGGRAPLPGVTQLTRAPRREDIDWGKTDQTAFIAHRAVLKDGRTVRWPYA